MSEDNTGAEFLNQRFPGLASSPEVKQAARRTQVRIGIEVPNNAEALIQNYLDRFTNIIESEDPKQKERSIKGLKKILTDRNIVRVEDIPEGYWKAQMGIVRSKGQAGDWQELSEEETLKIKREHLAKTKKDQKGSLEEWIDYLASDQSSYLPPHLKYWAFAGMLRLERYEKGREGKPGRFPERPTGRQRSIKMYPEVNERALRFFASAYEAMSKNQPIHFRHDIPPEARLAILGNLEKKDFRSLYGWGQEYFPPISKEEMQTTKGQWITYSQGSKSEALSRSLQGKGSGWCIAGENLAQEYLKNGNLFVYYTRDKEDKFTIPRVIIVSQGNRVTEVRGIEWEQNVDDHIKGTNIIVDKLKEIPGGKHFFETDADTKQLTIIDRKITSGMQLDRYELTFLYELDRPIKYFGNKKDPRIKELRSQRNQEEDLPIVFGCTPAQIAHRPEELRPDTKIYVGSLVPGIFDRLAKQQIEHVYTSFPEGKIRRQQIKIGGKTKTRLQLELFLACIDVSRWANNMIRSSDFMTLSTAQMLDTVRLKVGDLGCDDKHPTTDQLNQRARELGLELCPPEVGPQYRLQYKNQPLGESLNIGMKQISDSRGVPLVFVLGRHGGGLWLADRWAGSNEYWDPEHEFVFSLRK